MNVIKLVQNASKEASSISKEIKELSQVHVELFKVESAEYGEFIKKKVITGVFLGLLLFFLTAIALTAGISALGVVLTSYLPTEFQPYSWQLVALGVTILLLILVLIALLALKKKPKTPFFHHSKQELINEKAWLQNISKQKSSDS